MSSREGSVPGVTLPGGGETQGRDILGTESHSFPRATGPHCRHRLGLGPPGTRGTRDSGGKSPAAGTVGTLVSPTPVWVATTADVAAGGMCL